MADKKRLQVDIKASLFDRLKREAQKEGVMLWAKVQWVLESGYRALDKGESK
jgi:hypothetical protein